MSGTSSPSPLDGPRESGARALARLALGSAQMAGAAAALVLLSREGLTGRVLVLFVATTMLTAVSLVAFRRA
jgi:hypothetical protein